jgi:hypothetical protein
MSETRVVKLDDGKYEFDLEDGRMVMARRNGEEWAAGLDMRFSKCFVAALLRIVELEDQANELRTSRMEE